MTSLRPLLRLLLMASFLAVTTSAASSQGHKSPLRFGAGSKVSLAGDSTLHKYSAQTTQLSGWVELSPGEAPVSLEAAARGQRIQTLTVVIPVQSLRSGEKSLDENLWKTLEAAKHPSIVLTVHHYTLTGGTDGTAATVSAPASLSIAGVEREVTLQAHALSADGGLRVIGDQKLRMTDHKIRPPKFMGGLMKTSDEVTVHFDVRLSLQSEAAQTSR